jgi:pimeloyl-ACP methyl ester carboxylesterase
MPARLTLYLPQRPARVYDLRDGEDYVVGRDADTPLQADDDRVSRRHALVRSRGGSWSVVDLRSKNGTQVDGVDAPSARPLTGTSWVSFGGLLARFDLIGFDPRGIGRSTAVRCFGNPRQWSGYVTPFAFPVTPAEEAVWAAADRFLVDACDQRAPRLIDHMATADVARDLDLLRQAVGDAGLTYAGYSYGSYLGVTYANLFPGKVRALVVDGVLDPVAWSTGAAGQQHLPFSTRIRADAGAQATLDEFFRLCDAGSNCAFAGGAAARFAALAASLREAPILIVDPVSGATFPFSYADLVINALIAMYNSFSWPSFARLLAFLESGPAPTALGLRLQAFHEEAFITKRGFPRYPNVVEGFPSVACSDSDNPDSYAAWSSAASEAEEHFGYFGRYWTWISSICAAWPGADEDRYTGPFDRHTAKPVLVVGNHFDPATRYEGALAVRALLPNSSLLTVHGWGHVSLFLSQCADQAVSRYLLDGIPPPDGTVCTQDVVPFGSPAPTGAAAPALTATLRQARASLVPDVLLKAAVH